MKKFLSLAIILSGISFGALAQEGIKKPNSDKKSYVRKEYVRKDMVKLSPEQIAEKRTEKLEKELSLTSKQRNDIYKLQLDQANKLKKQHEIRQKEREQARKERLAQREKFEKILTPEQKEIWKEKFAKRGDHSFKRGEDRKKNFERRGDSKRRIEGKKVERDRRVG